MLHIHTILQPYIATALTAIVFRATFRTGFPQPPGPGGRLFLGQNTHGERKKIVPHPPSIFVLPAHARVRCTRAPRWVQVGYEDDVGSSGEQFCWNRPARVH